MLPHPTTQDISHLCGGWPKIISHNTKIPLSKHAEFEVTFAKVCYNFEPITVMHVDSCLPPTSLNTNTWEIDVQHEKTDLPSTSDVLA